MRVTTMTMRHLFPALGLTVLLVGCGTATPAATPPTPTPPTSTPPTSTPPTPDPPTAADTALAQAFIAFALAPTAEGAAALPLAPVVRLGFGTRLISNLSLDEAASPDAWVITPLRGALTGPYDALTLIQGFERRAGPARDLFTIAAGAHDRCAGPPGPAPAGLATARRIAVQPSPRLLDSCLSWFGVDLFLDGSGRIGAVTVDLWEP